MHNVYSSKGLDISISDIISSYKPDNLTHYVVGTVGVQLALVDMLKELEILPKKSLGYSLGAISSYYASGQIDFEQAALAAYFTNLTLTSMTDKENESIVLDVNKSKTSQQLLKYFKQFLPNKKSKSGKTKSVAEELIEKILVPNYENIVNSLERDEVLLEVGCDLVNRLKSDAMKKENKEKRKLYEKIFTGGNVINLVDVGQREPAQAFLEALGK